MTKTTEYIVAERSTTKADGRYPASRSTCYLGWLDLESGQWGWAQGGRAGAKRYTGRDKAFEVANRWKKAIQDAGYTPARIRVMPASGGADCIGN
jgi:hypothetical protein